MLEKLLLFTRSSTAIYTDIVRYTADEYLAHWDFHHQPCWWWLTKLAQWALAQPSGGLKLVGSNTNLFVEKQTQCNRCNSADHRITIGWKSSQSCSQLLEQRWKPYISPTYCIIKTNNQCVILFTALEQLFWSSYRNIGLLDRLTEYKDHSQVIFGDKL